MLFTVSQVSPEVELIFANTDKFINVYPTYHQKGGLIYRNVDSADWVIVGSQYRWEAAYPDINSETVPVIQLVYSYNSSAADRQAQYTAFRTITAVETVEGKLYLYAPANPGVDFRIRYRILNKLDLAISLNRLFGVGLGYTQTYEQLITQMSVFNPVNGQLTSYASAVPQATESRAGSMPGGVLSRIRKLEDLYNLTLSQPYRIEGYASDLAATPITTYYADIASVQAVASDTWYKECEIRTSTDASDFTTAFHLFYQQHATMLNITHIYTGNVTTFSYALAANGFLQRIVGLDLLDTHSATDISYMFAEDTALEELDLSKMCLSQVTNLEGLFKNCSSLTLLDVRSLDFATPLPDGTRLIDQSDVFMGVPDNCTIWVSGEAQRNAILSEYPNLTGITYN